MNASLLAQYEAGLARQAAAQAEAEAAAIREDQPDPAEFAPVRCRWRRCTEEAEQYGYCDVHYGTL